MTQPFDLTVLRSKQAEMSVTWTNRNLRPSAARADSVRVACISMFDSKRAEDTGFATADLGDVKALKRAELFVLYKAALSGRWRSLRGAASS